MIIIHTDNTSENDKKQIQIFIDKYFLRNSILKESERNCLLQLINYVIAERINDDVTELGYMGLLELKNKLQN